MAAEEDRFNRSAPITGVLFCPWSDQPFDNPFTKVAIIRLIAPIIA